MVVLAVVSRYLLVCPAFPVCSGWACSAGGQGVADSGGLCPMVLRHSVIQALDQGQWLGRCRTGRRWGRASRAGMLMMRRLSVEPRATALAPPASTPAARSRLWAIAAHRTQAELAPKRPEVICSSVVARPVYLLGCVVVSVADAAVNRVR